MPFLDAYTKGLFASMENSGKMEGDYLQLEKFTFNDLRNRGLFPADITWEKIHRYPNLYDTVANAYLQDLMQTYKIPTIEEAALWSYRPAYYQQYGGKIENIPEDIVGSFGKTARQIMQQRNTTLQGYLQKTKDIPTTVGQPQTPSTQQLEQQISSITPQSINPNTGLPYMINPITGFPYSGNPLRSYGPMEKSITEARMKLLRPYIQKMGQPVGKSRMPNEMQTLLGSAIYQPSKRFI